MHVIQSWLFEDLPENLEIFFFQKVDFWVLPSHIESVRFQGRSEHLRRPAIPDPPLRPPLAPPRVSAFFHQRPHASQPKHVWEVV